MVLQEMQAYASAAFSGWVSPSTTVRYDLPEATFYSSNVTDGLMSSGISPMTLGYLFRHSRDIRYCEGRHGGIFSGVFAPVLNQEHTEWASVLTSPFIFFCGLHMLLTWKHDDGLIMLISTLFALNGLAAGLAHLVGTSNWHNVDSHSMLLALWLSFALVGMEFFDHVHRTLAQKLGCIAPCCKWLRDKLKAILWLITMVIYFWIAETNGVFFDHEYGHKVGALAAALPLIVSVMIGGFFICLGCAKMSLAVGSRAYKASSRRFWFGVLIGFVGGVAWIATEFSCDRDDAIGAFFRAFPGHAVWHVTVSYGMMNALLFAGVLRADNFHNKVYVKTSGCCCYYFIFPALIYDDAEGIMPPSNPDQTPTSSGRNLMAGIGSALMSPARAASRGRIFTASGSAKVAPGAGGDMEITTYVESPGARHSRPGAPATAAASDDGFIPYGAQQA